MFKKGILWGFVQIGNYRKFAHLNEKAKAYNMYRNKRMEN